MIMMLCAFYLCLVSSKCFYACLFVGLFVVSVNKITQKVVHEIF